MQAIRLAEKLARFDDHWSPKVVAELNDDHVKLVKVQGRFVWHRHDEQDELFLVLHGELVIQLREGEIRLGPGELCVIPRGVEHRPRAEQETHILLIEPKTTRNTGHLRDARTVDAPEWI